MPHLLPSWWWRNEGALAEFVRSPLFTPGLMVRWTAQNLLLSAPVWAADFLFGAAVLRALEKDGKHNMPPALRAAAALAIGSGLSGLAMFLAGVAGLLKPAAVIGLIVLWAAAGAAALSRMRGWRWALSFMRLFRPRRPRLWTLAAGALFGALCITLLAGLMLPVLEFDSTMYHMRAARHYRETGSLAFNNDFRYNAHPHLSVLLYLRHWYVLGEDGQVKLQNLEFLLMIVLVLVYAAREWRWRGGSALGLLFVASSPLFQFFVQLEYSDLAVAAYFAVAAALLFEHVRRGGTASLAAGGLVLGFTAAAKLQGLVLAACACVGLAVAWIAARRGLSALARALVLLAALVALSGAGWWVRSWIHTGSPAYPFFAGPNPDLADTLLINHSYGLGHDWRAFLLLPWRMLVGPPWAFADATVFGIAGLLLAGAAIAALLLRRARPTPDVLFLAVTWGAYLAFWFRSGQVMRYVADTLPVMAILWIWLLWKLGVSRRPWVGRTLAVLLAGVVVYAALLMSMVVRRAVLPPVTYAQKEFALTVSLPYYAAVRELNRRAAPNERTYLLFCEECGYYVRTATSGDWHGTYPFRWLRMEGKSAADLLERFRKAGFRWVLVNRAGARRTAGIFDWPFAESGFVRPDVALPGAKTVYSDSGYGVVQLW